MGPDTSRGPRRRSRVAAHATLALGVLAAVLVVGVTVSTGATTASRSSPVPSASGVVGPVVAATAPGPARMSAQVPAQVPGEGSSCAPWDLSGCVADAVDVVLQRAVAGVLNPAVDMLGATLLSTPSLAELPRIAELWGMSWRLALAVYATLILVGGLIIMGHQTVQTRSAARDVLPRLLLGLLAGAASLPLCGFAVEIANAMSRAVMGEGVDPVAGAGGLRELLTRPLFGPTSQLGLLLVGLAVGVALIAVLCGWIARVSVLICLIAAAPLVLMWHALPQTEPVARWWWRAVASCLLMQVVQSLVLVVGLRILLSPGQTSTGVFGVQPTATSGLPSMLVLLVLLWILWQVPGWVWRSWVGGGNLGVKSLLSSAVKIGVAIKTGGLVGGALSRIGARKLLSSSNSGGAAPASGANHRTAGIGSGNTAGTSAGTGAGTGAGGGQLMLPIRAARVRKSAAGSRLTPPSPWIAYHPSLRDKIGPGYIGNRFAEHPPPPDPHDMSHRVAGGQQQLPLTEGLWPEQRPVAEPDGQWRWPIEPRRVPPSKAGTVLHPASPWTTYHPSLRDKIRPDYVGNRFAEHPPDAPERPGARRPTTGQRRLPLEFSPDPARRGAPAGPDPAQTALPISALRVAPPSRNPQRVADLPAREPWAGGHQPRDGQRPIPGVRAPRLGRDRLAYRFVPDGRPHPADLGLIPPDHVAHPLPRTPSSRLPWPPPPPEQPSPEQPRPGRPRGGQSRTDRGRPGGRQEP